MLFLLQPTSNFRRHKVFLGNGQLGPTQPLHNGSWLHLLLSLKKRNAWSKLASLQSLPCFWWVNYPRVTPFPDPFSITSFTTHHPRLVNIPVRTLIEFNYNSGKTYNACSLCGLLLPVFLRSHYLTSCDNHPIRFSSQLDSSRRFLYCVIFSSHL